MWRKTTEAKPSPQASDTPVSATPVSTSKSTTQPGIPAPADAVPVRVSPVTNKTVGSAGGSLSSSSSVSSGLQIHGEISGNADLYIDGEVQGKIRLQQSRVTVGPNGRVQADIEAREITIEGTVQGNLKAGECLRLGASSRVQGNVIAPRLAIADGAKLRGKAETTPANDARPTGVIKAGATTDSDVLRPAAVQGGKE